MVKKMSLGAIFLCLVFCLQACSAKTYLVKPDEWSGVGRVNKVIKMNGEIIKFDIIKHIDGGQIKNGMIVGYVKDEKSGRSSRVKIPIKEIRQILVQRVYVDLRKASLGPSVDPHVDTLPD